MSRATAEDLARIGWPVPAFRLREILHGAEVAEARKQHGAGHALVDGEILRLGDSLPDLQFICEKAEPWR